VRLVPGWRLDGARAGFRTASGHVELLSKLPAGSAIRPHVPALAARRDAQLSPAEQELARYVQVLLPAGVRKAAVRTVLEGLDCVEEVIEPPEVGLP